MKFELPDADHSTPEYWADDDETEGLKATQELSQQLQMFPENIATGRSSNDTCAAFKLPGSDLRRLLESAALYESLTTDADTRVLFSVTMGKLMCRMRRGDVFSSAATVIADPKATYLTDELAFQYPLCLVARLAGATTETINRLDHAKKLWSIKVPCSKTRLRLSADPVALVDIEPWHIGDRGPKQRIDPIALSRALRFVRAAATTHSDPKFLNVEVKNGVARGASEQAIASVKGEALQGISLALSAKDVSHVCRLLRRMDRNDTYLSNSSAFQFITSGALEVAIRIPRFRLPEQIENFLDLDADVSLSTQHEPLSLWLNAAKIIATRGAKLDIEVQRTSSTQLSWHAQTGIGTFQYTTSIIPRDDVGNDLGDHERRASAKSEAAIDLPSNSATAPFSARVDQDLLIKFLFAMHGAGTVTLGTRKLRLMVDAEIEGLRYRAQLSTIQMADVYDVSNGE